VLERCADGEGAREPTADGRSRKGTPARRELFGARELFVRTAPALRTTCSATVGCATSRRRRRPDARERRLARPGMRGAAKRNIHVYMQVMAASPPGYRVHFSGAHSQDQCLMPDGRPHDARVDRMRASPARTVAAYAAALASEVRHALPGRRGHSTRLARVILRTTSERAVRFQSGDDVAHRR
jgi:hypothetical protein